MRPYTFLIRKPVTIPLMLLFLIIMGGFQSLRAEGSEPQFIITEVAILTDKGTRSLAVRNKLRIPENKAFATYDQLEQYIAGKQQDLVNTRVLTSVRTSISEIGRTDAAYYYKVQFITTSSWSVYTRVTPEYDSNTGFIAGGELIYDNFFGTLTNFRVDMKSELQETDGIAQWSVNPAFTALRWGIFEFSLEFLQALNEQAQYDGEEYEEQYTYYSSEFFMDINLPILDDWFVTMSPGFSYFYNVKNYLGANDEIDKEDWNISNTFTFGYDRIDWIGNFKNGFSFDINQTFSLTSEVKKLKPDSLISLNTFEVDYFRAFERVNPSLSLVGFFSYEEDMSDLGSYLRGVRNDLVYGRSGLLLRNTLGIKLVEANRGNEFHLNPFWDVGLIRQDNTPFTLEDHFFSGVGFDVVIYNALQKSRISRISIGIDTTISDSGNTDKFELTFNSSLAY